jgi:hypothetical protein
LISEAWQNVEPFPCVRVMVACAAPEKGESAANRDADGFRALEPPNRRSRRSLRSVRAASWRTFAGNILDAGGDDVTGERARDVDRGLRWRSGSLACGCLKACGVPTRLKQIRSDGDGVESCETF